MTVFVEIDEINNAIEALGAASGWIHRYHCSHGILHIVLSGGGRRAHLHMQECEYLGGPTTWAGALRCSSEVRDGDQVITVSNAKSGFKAIGRSAWLSSTPPPGVADLSQGMQALQLALGVAASMVSADPVAAKVLIKQMQEIAGLMSEDRIDDAVAAFDGLAVQHPAFQPAADIAGLMRIRLIP